MDCLLQLLFFILICRGLFCLSETDKVSKNESSCPDDDLIQCFSSCPDDDLTQCFGIKRNPECVRHHLICDKTSNCYWKMTEIYCCNDTHECGIQDVTVDCYQSQTTFRNKTLLTLCSLHIKYTDNNKHEKLMSKDNIQEYQVFRAILGPRNLGNANNTKSLTVQGISSLNKQPFSDFLWLSSIDIRNTSLTTIFGHLFKGLQNLLTIKITNNPLLTAIQADAFVGLGNLTTLNISFNSITDLLDGTFHDLTSLRVIDLRGDKIHITSNFFEKNLMLTHIYADSYSFCCLKPLSVTSENCVTPAKNAVTSCDDLIEDRVLRVFLWIIGIMAVVGNLVVIVYHFAGSDPSKTETFSLFVTNLSISDAMMGVYMLIIGIHDSLFNKTYVFNEYEWKRSLLCKITGAMSYVSSESSVIFIFFITLDRLLAIKYPLSGWRITAKRAYVIIFLSWLISFFSAALPGKLYKGFYSRSGVCIALPLTGGTKEGRFYYSASVYLGFNFVVFLFIAVGQYLIFREIKLSSKRVGRALSGREKSVAKLLLLIVFTDCLCWIPIGILVILAICGVTIPDEMYAWVVVFIMPGNSAINPFLYTFAPACLKSRRASKRTSMLGNSKTENSNTKMSRVNLTEMKGSAV